MAFVRGALLSLLSLAIVGCSTEDDRCDADGACDGVSCSGFGSCAELGGGGVICVCDAGYHAGADGTSCVENVVGEECSGVDCGPGGSCAVSGGDTPVCLCGRGYHSVGPTTCVPDVDACAGVDCSGHGTCALSGGDTAVCVCDAGYRAGGDGTCVDDGGGDLTCGPGTHPEGEVCMPDGTERPPEFCMPEPRDPPGTITVATGFAVTPFLAGAADRFVVLLHFASPARLQAVSVLPDGTVRPAIAVADASTPSVAATRPSSVANQGTTVAVLLVDSPRDLSLLYLVDAASETSRNVPLTDLVLRVVAGHDGFWLLTGDSIRPLGLDGSLGSSIPVVSGTQALLGAAWLEGHGLAVVYIDDPASPDHLYWRLLDTDGSPLGSPVDVSPPGGATGNPFSTKVAGQGDTLGIVALIRNPVSRAFATELFAFDWSGTARGTPSIVYYGETLSALAWNGRFFLFAPTMIVADGNGRPLTDDYGFFDLLEGLTPSASVAGGSLAVLADGSVGVLATASVSSGESVLLSIAGCD